MFLHIIIISIRINNFCTFRLRSFHLDSYIISLCTVSSLGIALCSIVLSSSLIASGLSEIGHETGTQTPVGPIQCAVLTTKLQRMDRCRWNYSSSSVSDRSGRTSSSTKHKFFEQLSGQNQPTRLRSIDCDHQAMSHTFETDRVILVKFRILTLVTSDRYPWFLCLASTRCWMPLRLSDL